MAQSDQWAKPFDGPQVLDNGGAVLNAKHRRFAGGAKGDDATDDGAAFLALFRAAIKPTLYGHESLYFPTGIYRFAQSGLFHDIGATRKHGWLLQGSGQLTSTLKLITGGVTKWFYNNEPTPTLGYVIHNNLRFISDNRAFGNGWKIFSDGHEQYFHFNQCEFRDFNECVVVTGTRGNDSHKFVDTRVRECNTFLRLENPQAVVCEVFGSNIEGIYRDVYVVGPGGGGNLHVFGGSYVMDKPAATDTVPHYLLNVTGSNNVGPANARFLFVGIKTELRTVHARLVKCEEALGQAFISFDGCNFRTANGGVREAVRLGMGKTLLFRDCVLPDDFTYTLVSDASLSTTREPVLIFENCQIPENLSDKIKFEGGGYGRVIAKGCYFHSRILATAGEPRQAPDFDMGGLLSLRGDPAAQLKSVEIERNNRGFPTLGGNERSIKLPKGARLRSVRIHKPATGSSTSVYQLNVGNGDKTVVYGSSASGAQSLAHTIHVDLSPIRELNTAADRVVRLWATGGDQIHGGGYMTVEYY